jgi:hypothetical protein
MPKMKEKWEARVFHRQICPIMVRDTDVVNETYWSLRAQAELACGRGRIGIGLASASFILSICAVFL